MIIYLFYYKWYIATLLHFNDVYSNFTTPYINFTTLHFETGIYNRIVKHDFSSSTMNNYEYYFAVFESFIIFVRRLGGSWE